MSENIPLTPEQFEKLYQLDPESNKRQTFNYVSSFLQRNLKGFDGKPIDFEFIVAKYNLYCDWWQRKHGATDPKFISKADKRVPIVKYLSTSMYDNQFGMGKSGRDFYMLGQMGFDVLSNKVKQFKDVLAKRDPDYLNKQRDSFIIKPDDGKTGISKEQPVQSELF